MQSAPQKQDAKYLFRDAYFSLLSKLSLIDFNTECNLCFLSYYTFTCAVKRIKKFYSLLDFYVQIIYVTIVDYWDGLQSDFKYIGIITI